MARRKKKAADVDADIEAMLGFEPIKQEQVSLDLKDVTYGVSTAWLGQVFGMHPMTVKQRLAECPPIRRERGGQPRYDLKQAASYLVPPKVDIVKWISKLR